MRKTIFAIAAALALSGCGMLPMLTGIPAAPVAVADKTKIDEQAALGVELAYQGANLAVLTATRAGFIKGDVALRVADADNRAYKAVLATRAAYDAGNSTSYGAASEKARAAISEMIAALK